MPGPRHGGFFIGGAKIFVGNYVVTSLLPRSGTSAMMECLQACGIPLHYDEKHESYLKAATNQACPANDGFYEHSFDTIMSTGFPDCERHAIKVMCDFVLAIRPASYRIVFMTRNPAEIVESNWRIFNVKLHANPDEYWARAADRIGILKQRHDCDVIEIDFNRAHADPVAELGKLKAWGLDIPSGIWKQEKYRVVA